MGTTGGARELVVLGTSAQVPTRERNHNGYFLRWDATGMLFDPGEGTQRQMLLAGVRASSVDVICLTHAHGDHCLGLPGVLQRRVVDKVHAPVDLCYPAGASAHVAALQTASATAVPARVAEHPVSADGPVISREAWALSARSLDHRVPTVGWRVEEPARRAMDPALLARAGVHGPDIGRLQRTGQVRIGRRTVHVEEVSELRRGQRFAFVMDTRPCANARLLADGVDLLVCESTYLERDADLAEEFGHMTARQAGALAADARARRLVLTHFSRRYGTDPAPFATEAADAFDDVVIARDLARVPVPPRQ